MMTDLDTRFDTLRRRVAAVTVTPEAAGVIRRGQRRRTGRLAAVCLLALALVAAGLALGRPPVHRDLPGGPPTTAPWDEPEAKRFDLRPHLVDGYLLHGNPDATGTSDPSPPWAVGATYTDAVSIMRPGHVANGDLAVFADEAAARAVFRTIARNPLAAEGFPDVKAYRNEQPAIGDEAVAATGPLPADGAGEYTGQPLRVVGVRVGTAVLLFYGWTCAFTFRCQPLTGLPAPLTTLTEGGTAWAVPVQVRQTDTEPYAAALMRMAALGYRVRAVSLACDVGARAALSENAPQATYLVVYFTTEADAATVARAVGGDTHPVRVRTHCT
jgi:hypothetical protein